MVTASELEETLRTHLREDVLEFTLARRNRVFSKVRNGSHRQAVKLFQDMGGHLSVITSVDLGEELELVYHFELHPLQVSLKTSAPRGNPRIETISDIYPSAAWYEREAMEMMGITVVNHPDPRHLFLPDDYTEYPLRRF
ncbi:MAG: NADH-quinone oxidoreductase subunit C [Theionarchaea archaeon]|nr:NADH-quinone oxidoreductase subunit C [Theionarchaea archaeon]MBU6999431.1 NADH-quinone oxidoreductase subunit C [Theionarchaea archaeon]MBU7022338.1 NADH-quinone oxidoreductase subunit C [Theionarchaea archaeon]MBU7035858.1 NADH-quinone oxidoreductase subunit C [Theionarchaea archaeon]MBU7041608.1 NADH-quinone oxidoreductase subunit C [Theionarchaea archaeon]